MSTVKRLSKSEKSVVDAYFEIVKQICFESFEEDQRPRESYLREAFDTGDVFLALDKYGIATGYAIVTDASSPLIWSIAVSPASQGKGVGMSLLMEIEQFYQIVAEEIRLTVNVNNPAQKLYFDAGYRVTNIFRRHYPGGIDGLCMKKVFEKPLTMMDEGLRKKVQ